MKIGVIKIGARIAFGASDTSGGSGEARRVCQMLAEGGAEVHIFTKILKKDTLVPLYHWHDIVPEADKINDLSIDAFVVINGSTNYFGGAPADEATINYKIINEFKGPVFYIYCDPNLSFRQIWPVVEAKNPIWEEKFKARTWSKEEIDVTREDVFVICQSYNTEHAASQFEKKSFVKLRGIENYPFDRFPLLEDKPTLVWEPSVDLSYGGTMRGGKREKKLIDFYFGYPQDISVEVFGKIKADDFNPKKVGDLRHPTYSGAVPFNEMVDKMSQAFAHVVIGDEAYSKFDIMSQRTYEAVLAGCVTFIDESLDVNKRMYGGNKELSGLLYVKDRNDVIERIRMLKDVGVGAGREIANDILNHWNFDRAEYCKGFVELIKKNM